MRVSLNTHLNNDRKKNITQMMDMYRENPLFFNNKNHVTLYDFNCSVKNSIVHCYKKFAKPTVFEISKQEIFLV